MTTSTLATAGTVSRYWKTGLIITHADLTGIIASNPADAHDDQEGCQALPPGSVPWLGLLEEQFLASMNALAAASGARHPAPRPIFVPAPPPRPEPARVMAQRVIRVSTIRSTQS